jgi:hypothetical protein
MTLKEYFRRMSIALAYCSFRLNKKGIHINFHTRCNNIIDKEKILKYLELCLDEYINKSEKQTPKASLVLVDKKPSSMDEETKKRLTIKTGDVLSYEGQDKQFKTIFHEYFYYIKKAFWE